VGSAERTIGYGIVAGLVVSQANWALFEDLVNRQASFDGVGWASWFLYVLVPVLAGGVLLHYGRTSPDARERGPGRAALASVLAAAAASAALRVLVPAMLHAGDVLPPRLPRTLADGFTFVAEYTRVAPVAGQGNKYTFVTAVGCAGVMAAAVAFGALAFRVRLLPLIAAALTGAAVAGVGWFVPGGAGARIIGALWPPLFMATVAATLVLTDRGLRSNLHEGGPKRSADARVTDGT
jgi:hypothetical protein